MSGVVEFISQNTVSAGSSLTEKDVIAAVDKMTALNNLYKTAYSKFPPPSLYDALVIATIGVVPGSPYWRYDGDFMWLPMPQRGYERFNNGRKK